jgi:hypothetical protein
MHLFTQRVHLPAAGVSEGIDTWWIFGAALDILTPARQGPGRLKLWQWVYSVWVV